MKYTLVIALFLLSIGSATAQNQNISGGQLFEGEPYLSIDPNNPQHMVVAWIGFVLFNEISIKTKVTFDAGQTWSNAMNIPHYVPTYGSADPSLYYDNNGNVFLCYVDYDADIDSGSVYVRSSTDGGMSWGSPVEVINAQSDVGQYPVDRPWMSIDRSGGVNDGNIYITTMPPNVFGPLVPPHHPYFVLSTDGGATFDPWQYLDNVDWLSGDNIQQPMPTHTVSSNGTFHAVYPSWVTSQNFLPQFIIASSTDGGTSFSYHSVLASLTSANDPNAKKGYLLRSNPADPDHLLFFHLDEVNGDADIYMTESFDAGVSWSSGTRINDDPIGNDRMQDLVWADLDLDGDLVVSWRDRRNGASSNYNSDTEIWGAVRWKDSTDFSPNFRISDTIVEHNIILNGSGNDFMCIKLMDDTLSAVWGDVRNGSLNIWFQRMDLNGTILSIQQISAVDLLVLNVFPNPSSNFIELEFSAPELVESTKIFDLNGKVVFEMNKFRTMLDISEFVDGTYIVQIQVGNALYSKKWIKE